MQTCAFVDKFIAHVRTYVNAWKTALIAVMSEITSVNLILPFLASCCIDPLRPVLCCTFFPKNV